MGLLSRVSYLKIQWLSTKIEIRCCLNVIGLCSNKRTERKNREDFIMIVMLYANLNDEDEKKLEKYLERHPKMKMG